jgi:hypothetical protein
MYYQNETLSSSCPTWNPQNIEWPSDDEIAKIVADGGSVPYEPAADLERYINFFNNTSQHEDNIMTFNESCDPYTNTSSACEVVYAFNNTAVVDPSFWKAAQPDWEVSDEWKDAVCAFDYIDCSSYRMVTYRTKEEAESDGSFPMHYGACGVCSTGQDLAIYLKYVDLTEPGTKCGTKAKLGGMEKGLECYQDFGFTPGCALTWVYDALHTGSYTECLARCAADMLVNTPYNIEDKGCKMNDCVQCDEDKSVPTFTATAGLSRRRSGQFSEINRPCSSVHQMAQTIPDQCSEDSSRVFV